jgi:NAD(P)-dependent dehydrogenase (short-subunit alcohol dehydrogenase family)
LKSVLITGACGGVGQALVSLLNEQGWQVYGTDIAGRPPHLDFTDFWQGNVAEESFWCNQVLPGIKEARSLDAFVHNAAVQPCTPLVETSVKEWTDTLAVNLTAAFLGTRYLLPLLRTVGGAIVNVASVHALATSPGMAAYVTSKGGLVAFTRAAALELAEHSVRVNAVLPGAVGTSMLERGLRRNPAGTELAKARLLERTPLRRIATPAEIAKAVSFLIDSEQSAFITGQTLVVDGGVLARLSSE